MLTLRTKARLTLTSILTLSECLSIRNGIAYLHSSSPDAGRIKLSAIVTESAIYSQY